MIILKKIKVNYLTLFIILSSFFCGMFNYIFILFTIIIVHEIGHIISIKLFKYKIINIEILPFGGKVNISKKVNSSINKELLIAISGLIMQLLFFIIIYYLYLNNSVNQNYFLIFKNYNISLFLFNILPIYPLDGFFILKLLLEKFNSFYLANYLSIIFSFIILIIFIIINYIFNYNNFIICVFLIYKLLEYLKDIKIVYNLFLLERYLYNIKFKKNRVIYGMNYKKMYKENKHYFLIDNNLYNEKRILAKLFDKNKHIC